MSNLLDEIRVDVNFVRSHTLQPKWYKALKVVLLVGFLAGYGRLFSLARTAVFLASFLLLSLAVHLTYRAQTQRFQRSWLDFVAASSVQRRSAYRALSSPSCIGRKRPADRWPTSESWQHNRRTCH